VTVALAVAGVVLTCIGVGLVLMSEESRGLSAGLGLAAAGLGLTVGASVQLGAGLVLAVGGICSAALRLREGGGWGLLPPGSTSRIVLFVVAVAASLYAVTSVLPGPATEARAAALAAAVLAGARLLGTGNRSAALAAAAALALAAGALGTAQTSGALLPAATAGFVALLAGWVPGSEVERAPGGA
jgi:hypothetical protein